MMTLSPIRIDEDKTNELYASPECQGIFDSYPDYYYKTGYHPPWIGYFVLRDKKVVGVGGFTGKPKDGRIEITYGTFKEFEGQGVASFSCKALMDLAKATDPQVFITAKTAPENNASTKILQRNGFEYSRVVQDEGIGDAWEWIYNEIH